MAVPKARISQNMMGRLGKTPRRPRPGEDEQENGHDGYGDSGPPARRKHQEIEDINPADVQGGHIGRDRRQIAGYILK